MSISSQRMVPDLGEINPPNNLASVLFPQPSGANHGLDLTGVHREAHVGQHVVVACWKTKDTPSTVIDEGRIGTCFADFTSSGAGIRARKSSKLRRNATPDSTEVNAPPAPLRDRKSVV